MNRIALLVLVAALSAAAPSGSQTVSQPNLDSVAIEAELRTLEAAHAAAVDAKDVEGVLRFYSPDLVTMAGTQPILRGRDWIRTAMAKLYRTYDFHESFKLADIRVLGDRIAATYRYEQRMTPLAGGAPIAERGQGICILKRSPQGPWQFEWNAYIADVDRSPATR